MRCKRHTVDFSSNVGVCASCLRERLLSLAASAAITEENNRQSQSRKSNNNNNNHPPLLIFPRSVSPYVTRRKSDAGGGGWRDSLASNHHHRRFFTTPQVDLGISCKDFESVSISNPKSFKPKRGGGGFYRFSNIFRTRSEDLDSNRKSNPRFSCDVVSESSTASSRSWISAILSTGRSKKQPNTTACYIEDVIAGRRPQRVFCRGMSPARDTEPEEEHEQPPPESIEETPGRLRTTPATKTPGIKKITNGMGKMAFCLSPLVRASPNCPFKRKIRFPPSDYGNSGEVTASEKPHISAAASFCANRSKKLADLGRVNPRR